jgi:hypothetical protein
MKQWPRHQLRQGHGRSCGGNGSSGDIMEDKIDSKFPLQQRLVAPFASALSPTIAPVYIAPPSTPGPTTSPTSVNVTIDFDALPNGTSLSDCRD